ncbi:hypothetical protein ACKKBG_A09975 [Auxenochlorella protothecoides x Auxenochlorella symbiontica]
MPLAEGWVKESMRRTPVVPIVPRTAIQGFEVGGFWVRPGQPVVAGLRSTMQLDPRWAAVESCSKGEAVWEAVTEMGWGGAEGRTGMRRAWIVRWPNTRACTRPRCQRGVVFSTQGPALGVEPDGHLTALRRSVAGLRAANLWPSVQSGGWRQRHPGTPRGCRLGAGPASAWATSSPWRSSRSFWPC